MPPIKHVLSKELQTYYEKVTEAIEGSNPELREAAFNSLSNDPGLNQLVPYFNRYVAKEVIANLQKGGRYD